MKITKDEIYLFRMNTGEEVIAKVVSLDENVPRLLTEEKGASESNFSDLDFMVLYRPRVLVPQMVRDPQTGQPGMQLGIMNWFNGNPDTDEALVRASTITGASEPFSAAIQYYEESITDIDLTGANQGFNLQQ